MKNLRYMLIASIFSLPASAFGKLLGYGHEP